MRIMGIDQSFTCTGVWIFDYECNETVYYCGIKSKNGDYIDNIERAEYITSEIINIATSYVIDKVNIEGLSFGSNGQSTRDLGGLFFLIISNLRKNGFDEIDVISPKTLKKISTGNGNASKDDMFDALPDGEQERINHFTTKKEREDLTDAYFLATYKENE